MMKKRAHCRLAGTAEHLSGLFYIQEASSMLPVAALFADDNHPQRVMDMAAARPNHADRCPHGEPRRHSGQRISASRVKFTR